MNTNSALIVPAQPAAASNAPPAQFQEAIKPLIDIPNVWLWVMWIAGLLLALAAAWFAWRYWRRKAAAASIVPPLAPAPSRPPPSRRSPAPHRRAEALLHRRLRRHPPLPSKNASNSTPPTATTEEFLYELQTTNLLTQDQKASLAEFLANCDLIKFAKYEPTELELRALHAAALRLVNETEPRLVPETLPSSTTAAP